MDESEITIILREGSFREEGKEGVSIVILQTRK